MPGTPRGGSHPEAAPGILLVRVLLSFGNPGQEKPTFYSDLKARCFKETAQPGSPAWDRILGSEPHTRQAARPQSRPGFGADARTEPDWIPIPHDLSP